MMAAVLASLFARAAGGAGQAGRHHPGGGVSDAAAPPPTVETRHLTRILPLEVPVTLVEDASIRIDPGEFVSIVGPSGSGKSSLLYLLGLLDSPTSGEVLIEGEATSELSPERLAALRLARIGFVFPVPFPAAGVLHRRQCRHPDAQARGRLNERQARDRACDLLEGLGLADQIGKNPDQLSGGQRQRVAIARALANEPALVLADEPTGSLDQKSSAVVSDIFAGLSAERNVTVAMVTHDRDMAARCDRQIRIVDGRIEIAVGTRRRLACRNVARRPRAVAGGREPAPIIPAIHPVQGGLSTCWTARRRAFRSWI